MTYASTPDTRIGKEKTTAVTNVGTDCAQAYSADERERKKKMKSRCLHYRCVKCCLNTEMPLSTSDILRIRRLGFSDDFFIAKRNGERRLKNSMGRCVFHNGQLCTIYIGRPEGCRIYPVIFDVHRGKAVLDGDCPHRGKFQVTPSISREVIKLVRKLSEERNRCLKSRER